MFGQKEGRYFLLGMLATTNFKKHYIAEIEYNMLSKIYAEKIFTGIQLSSNKKEETEIVNNNSKKTTNNSDKKLQGGMLPGTNFQGQSKVKNTHLKGSIKEKQVWQLLADYSP
ncbi:MAG TPA: hypothetical protein DCQ31_03580, partial [Bacteroidales bacterium]|nr:hypothetical protein [Bacteroidales bacterium]